METIIYFVRHAESPFIADIERTRGLSEKGEFKSIQVKNILIDQKIDYILSSPYERAIQTVKPLADELKKEIIVFEGLKERALGNIGDIQFKEAKQQLYLDFSFHFQGGESSKDSQERAIKDMNKILQEFEGKIIVIGTHGDIMTLMMNYFDDRYDINFWESTSMPDIYQLRFKEDILKEVKRIWE